MKRTRMLTPAIVGTVAAFSVAALASFAAVAQESENQKPTPAQIARGAKAWAETCNHCHNLRDPKELTDEDWDVSVNHMRVRANLPAQLARDIKAFLKSSN